MMRSYSTLFCWLGVIFAPVVVSAALQNGKVEVGVVKGTASLTDPQAKKTPLAKGIVFEEGYRVDTDTESSAELILSNGSTLIVSPDTSLEVRTFRQVPSSLIIEGQYQKLDKEPSPSVTDILVYHGKVIGEARKLNPQSSYTIKTPAGVARIRGTIFSVEYAVDPKTGSGSMSIACIRGSVEATVSNTAAGPIPVPPGKAVTVTGIKDVMSLAAAVLDNNTGPAKNNKTNTNPAVDPNGGGAIPGVNTNVPTTGTTVIDNQPTPPPANTPAIAVSLGDLDSTQLASVATNLANSTSLPTSIVNDVNDMAKAAPAPGQTTVQQVNSAPATQQGAPVGTAPVTPPSDAPKTSSGGSTSTTDQLMQQISNVVDKAVEKQQQPDPSPTGG